MFSETTDAAALPIKIVCVIDFDKDDEDKLTSSASCSRCCLIKVSVL